MLQLAEEKLIKNNLTENCSLMNHNFVNQALPQTFGLGLVTFYTFNYLLSPEDQRAFLHHVAESLLPGASLALHLFYPGPLLYPEIEGKWINKGRYQIENQTVFLHDFRRMVDEHTEERLQAFEYESGRREEIRTLRRLVKKNEIRRLLISAGFSDPVLVNNFNWEDLTTLTPDLETESEFVVTAKKT